MLSEALLSNVHRHQYRFLSFFLNQTYAASDGLVVINATWTGGRLNFQKDRGLFTVLLLALLYDTVLSYDGQHKSRSRPVDSLFIYSGP